MTSKAVDHVTRPVQQAHSDGGLARHLHSKFVIRDGRKVLLASHNWSAGSYSQFDDTTELID